MSILLITICCFGLSALLTWAVREIAKSSGLAFGPESDRHIHTSPIPRLGGIAIFCTFITGFGFYLLAAARGLVPAPTNDDALKVLAPAVFLFAVGLIDDLKGLRAYTKLLAQIAGGMCLYFSGIRFACFHTPFGTWADAPICLAITVFWVVLVCNAINLIDGLDGLAAGATLFSMVTIFTVAIMQGRTGVAVATAIMAGAVLGFLLFNSNPASIFMGDSGSLFVGFILSGLVLAELPKQHASLGTFFIPLMSFALPLTDTAVSVVRRFLSGHKLFGADKEHIHHKLLELGLSHRQAVWVLYSVGGSFAVLSLFLLKPSNLLLIPAGCVVVMGLFLGVRKLGYHEFIELQRVWKRVRQQREVFARNIAIRRCIAELTEIHQFDKVLGLLETALEPEFDGFEIALTSEIPTPPLTEGHGKKSVRRVWNDEAEAAATFSLELGTVHLGPIGQLSLFRHSRASWMVDADLLMVELRDSLGVAMENCLCAGLFMVYTPAAPERQVAERELVDLTPEPALSK
jgi:UDP-GlcNAc:undecaprenyl-phosphate/decaprenyl-phosphate GlcNAc-1-phosphate transferase